jgi:hypothetical protein
MHCGYEGLRSELSRFRFGVTFPPEDRERWDTHRSTPTLAPIETRADLDDNAVMEVHLPFRHPPGSAPSTEVRSTMLVSGIQALRSRGLYDRYLAALPPHLRQQFMTLIPGVWLPIESAVEHYRAADKLALEARVIEGIGAEVAERINKGPLSVAVQVSKRVGVTPWTALALVHRINDLNWRGGDVAVYKVGPKEAIYEWTGQPCAGVPYFATSLGGYLRTLTSLFSDKAHARTLQERCTATTVSCKLSWV